MYPVHAREWRWVSTVAGVLLALVAGPYALAFLHPPEGYLLARTLYYGNDLSQYLAAMGDGMSTSSWLVYDHLSAEPHRPALMYPFYVLLGKTAGLLAVPPLALFGLFVALSPVALAFAGYTFAAAFVDAVWERRLALLFLLFASGVGIWVAAFTLSGPDATPGIFGFDRAEVSTYLLPFGSPHLPLALSLLLVSGRSLASWAWEGRRSSLAGLLLAVQGLGLLNPFSLVSLLAVAGGYALLRWVSLARFPWREAVATLAAAAASAPWFVSSLLSFAMDPFWSATYSRQNLTGTAEPWVLGMDLGAVLPLGLIGAAWGKGRGRTRLLLSAWVAALLLAMYLPVPYQRRFGFGVHAALAVLAVLGVDRLRHWLLSGRPHALLRLSFSALVATLAFAGTMMGYVLLIIASLGIGGLGKAVFEPRSHVEASAWMAEHTAEEDVVLSSLETGNFLAGQIRGRVVVGHRAGTLDSRPKEALVHSFFAPSATPEDRLRLAAELKATHVFLGPRERALGGEPLTPDQGFRLVYDREGVQIYRIEGPVRRATRYSWRSHSMEALLPTLSVRRPR